ncbi:hypothetical protein JAAARDRAFT_87353, partial [Jaapia argillacea MUCL 33604]
SYIFRKFIRNYKSQSKKTWSWGLVSQQEAQVQKHARVYAQCRQALVHLRAPDALLEKYRVLEKSDCRVTTGIIDDHQRRGTRNTVLPWIWSI